MNKISFNLKTCKFVKEPNYKERMIKVYKLFYNTYKNEFKFKVSIWFDLKDEGIGISSINNKNISINEFIEFVNKIDDNLDKNDKRYDSIYEKTLLDDKEYEEKVDFKIKLI